MNIFSTHVKCVKHRWATGEEIRSCTHDARAESHYLVSVSSLNNYQFSFNLDLLTRVFGESLNTEGFSPRVIQGKACDHAIHITHAMPSGDL